MPLRHVFIVDLSSVVASEFFFHVNHHFLVKLWTEYFIIQILVLTYLKKFNVVLGALKI